MHIFITAVFTRFPTVETTEVPNNQWMDKEKKKYIYMYVYIQTYTHVHKHITEYLLSHKEKLNYVIFRKMNETKDHHSE
jgi:hypothetical protein